MKQRVIEQESPETLYELTMEIMDASVMAQAIRELDPFYPLFKTVPCWLVPHWTGFTGLTDSERLRIARAFYGQ